MSLVNHETGELVPIHPEEPGAIAMLDQAILALTTALDQMPISEVVNLKAKVATVATATRELGMSKEAQELAIEAVRRAEWALGRAIRKGQAEGSVATHGGKRHGSSPATQDLKPVTNFASNGELYGRGDTGILNLADADPDDFDAAIDEAKAEGNLSRANVARKAREKSGKSTPAKARDDAETYLNSIEALAAKAAREAKNLTADQIRRIKPKADLWTVGLRDSIETLQRLVDSLTTIEESK